MRWQNMAVRLRLSLNVRIGKVSLRQIEVTAHRGLALWFQPD
jgi:hypothetical protein